MFSEGINIWLQQFSQPWLDHVFTGITYLGSEYLYLLLLTFVYWCVSKRSGRSLFLAFLISAWLNSVLKDGLGMARPSGDLVRVLAYEWTSGFPSGHAQNAAVVWFYMAMRWPKRWLITLSTSLVLLISLSRLYLGVHYLGQVLAGIVLGLACAVLVYVCQKRSKPTFQPSAWRVAITVLLSYLVAVPVQSDEGFRIAGVLLGFLLTDAIPRRSKGTAPEEWHIPSEERISLRTAAARSCVGWVGLGVGYMAVKLLAAPGLPTLLGYAAIAVWVTSGAPAVFTRLKLSEQHNQAETDPPDDYPIPAAVPLPRLVSFVPATTPIYTSGLFLLLSLGLTLPSVQVAGRDDNAPAIVEVSSVSTYTPLPALHTAETFLVMGHKGGEGLAPGNTLAAFGQGLQAGSHILECDVRRTLDGHLVVIHDERVDAVTNGTGAVNSLTLKDIRRLDAGYRFTTDDENFPYRGKDVRIPTLEALLEAYPDARFNIDMKDHSSDTPHALLAAIDAANARNRVIIASFDGPTIRRFRQLAPDIPTTLASDEVMRLVIMTRLGLGAFYQPPARYIQVPERQGVVQLITPSFIKLAHRLGMEVHVWTVNNRTNMQRLLEAGVDGIITDYPNRLVDVLVGRSTP